MAVEVDEVVANDASVLQQEIAEDRAARMGQVVSHCPFGCEKDDLDPSGYCNHLLGFTNDGKFYEPILPVMGHTTDGEEYDTGMHKVGSFEGRGRAKKPVRLKVEKSMVLVNPESVQKNDAGVPHVKKEWVSARVYGKEGRPKTE